MARTDKPTPTVGKYGQKGTGPTGNMTTDVGRYWEVPGSASFGAGWRFNYDNMTWEHPASGSTSSPTEFVNQNLNEPWLNEFYANFNTTMGKDFQAWARTQPGGSTGGGTGGTAGGGFGVVDPKRMSSLGNAAYLSYAVPANVPGG